jgi:hypothetical protein
MVFRKITSVGVMVGIFLSLIALINTISLSFIFRKRSPLRYPERRFLAGAISCGLNLVALRHRLDLSGTEAVCAWPMD